MIPEFADEPLVSIVIPCFNAEGFLGNAIESALAQTYPNIEVIVIDDGSTDGTSDVIGSYGDRIRWATGQNQGGSAARNRGIGLAGGDLVQFLDADDVLYPDKLATQVRMAQANGARATPVCDWERVADGVGIAATPQRLDYRGEDAVVYCLGHQIPICSPLHWKRDLEAVGGFDESLPCSQERDLHLKLACRGGELVYLPQVLCKVRRRTGSVSADYRQVLRQHGGIFRRAYEALATRGQLSEERACAFAKATARDARHCLRCGDVFTAKAYFQLAKWMHREGALSAFGRRELRVAARLFGPVSAERLCQLALRLRVSG